MSSRASRLGKNTLLVFLGNFGAKAIGLVMLPFYTHWLSVEGYGLTDIISVYVTFLLYIVSCDITESIFIFPKGADIEKQIRYFTSGNIFILFMLVLTATIFIIIECLIGIYHIENSFTQNLWLIYFMMASQIIQNLYQQFTRSIDKIKIYSITGIICTACTALYAFVFIPPYGVAGYVWSIILAHVTAGLYSFVCSRSYKFLKIKSFDYSLLKEMLLYSIPLIPNSIMWWLVNALNRPIMERYVGIDGVGIYAVANKFPSILTMTFTVFLLSWQISVIEEFGKEGYSKFYNKVFRLVFSFLLVVVMTITLFSKPLVMFFSDEAYYSAWMYIPLLTMGVFFSNIAGFAGVNFSATRESKYYFYSSIAAALSAIVFNVLLIPQLGLIGACLALMISFIVMAISRVSFAWKYVKIEGIPKYLFYIFLASAYITISMYDVSLAENILVYTLIIAIILYAERSSLVMILEKLRNRIKK